MNTPNPLVPQGTLPDKGKAQIRITVFAILAIHVVLLGVLLIAGCNKKAEPEPVPENTGLPPVPTAMDPTWPEPPPALPSTPVTSDATQLPPPVPSTVPETTYVQPPVPEPVPVDVPVDTGYSEHTISKGESFYTIARKYGLGTKSLVEANPGMNPTRLKIGDIIKIPPAKTAGASSINGSVAPAADGTKTYKVRSGDNLTKIAKNHGVTIRELRAANNLRTDQIKVGQKLKIPVKESAPPPVLESIPPVPSAPPQ